ncbi:hypothetical protein QEN19_002963 [Hanseniaspora menglaensis]
MSAHLNRFIRESKDLATSQSLTVISYYFDLHLIDLLIQNDYADKNFIANLLDKVEIYKQENITGNETNVLLQQMIKFCIIIYKKNIDLSKSIFNGTGANLTEVIQSIWLNIDLIEVLKNTFDVDENEDIESKELLQKFDSDGKLKTLKLVLKKVLLFSKADNPENEVDDEELLKQQMDSFEEEVDITPGKTISEDKEEEPDFDDDDDDEVLPPTLFQANHSLSSLQLPTPPKNEENNENKMITKNIDLSSDSDYNSSEISDLVTSQETIDKMVKIAKIGIQCIQYEDFEVAKGNFEDLLTILQQEIGKM